MARRYRAEDVSRLESQAAQAERDYQAGGLPAGERDAAIADYRRAVRAMARRRQRGTAQLRAAGKEAPPASPVPGISPAAQGYFRAPSAPVEGARSRKGRPGLGTRPREQVDRAEALQRARQAAEARDQLRLLREQRKAQQAVDRARQAEERAQRRAELAEQRAESLSGRRQLQAQAQAERLSQQLEDKRQRRKEAEKEARAPRAPRRRRPEKAPEPASVQKFRRALEAQGMDPDKLEKAVKKYADSQAKQEAGRESRPAAQQASGEARAKVERSPGAQRYRRYLEGQVSSGAMTRAQADRALHGWVEGQARATEERERQAAERKARQDAMTPAERRAAERAEEREKRERRAKRQEEREERARRARERGDQGGEKRSQREQIPLEGTAIRSGGIGGSFTEDAFVASSSLFDKYEQSSLFQEGYDNLKSVSVRDMSGRQLDIPDSVTRQGAEAVAAWTEEQARQGLIDWEWLMYSAEGVEDDIGDGYEGTVR